MKNSLIVALVLGIVMLALPLSTLKAESERVFPVLSEQGNIPADEPPSPAAYKSFKIKLTETGKIEEISAEDYIIGVVASEMPASYSEEALKAQAIAAYTFACYKKGNSTADFDLTDNPQTDQCYQNLDSLRENWGESAESNLKKVTDAVNEVKGMLLTYDGAIALTCYHAISSGKTESCKDVWGNDLPYLTAVDSVGDKLAESYLTTKSFTADEVSKALSSFKTSEGAHSTWFGEPTRTDSGRVLKISYCQKELSGGEIAEALKLRSANFEITPNEEGFEFTVKGYGHGVGMSQNGAEYMARQGSDYKEILNHYYKGCKLQKAKLQ